MKPNNEYEQEIDLKDLMFAVLRKWRLILAAAVLFAVLLGGYKMAGGLRQMQDTAYVEENRAAYERDLEQYEDNKERLGREIENIQASIDEQEKYKEESIRMNINPYDVYEEKLSLYISTDYVILPGMAYQNPNTAASILKAYMTIAQNGEMYNYVLAKMDQGMELRYLKELVTITADYENNMLDIAVIGDTKERAAMVMRYIKECIENSHEAVTQAIGAHEVHVVNESSAVTVSLDLEQEQKDFTAKIDQLDQSLTEKTDELDALEEPANTLLSRGSVMKSTVKYGVLGGGLGAFVVVFFVCVAFLMSDKLVNEKELKRRYGLVVLGVFARKEKGVFAFVDRWLNRLESSAGQDMSETQIFEVAAANALNHMDGVREVLLIGTAKPEALEAVKNGLTGLLEGANLTVGGDINKEAQAIKKAAACDAVIVVEQRNHSLFGGIEQELDVVQKLDKKIRGCMIF